VIAVAPTCCQAVLQSTNEQWEQHFAQGSAATPWCWATADLHEEQIFIGVIAMAPTCCQAVLQSTNEQW